MRHLPTILVITVLASIGISIVSGCVKQSRYVNQSRERTPVEHFASDTLNVYVPLKPIDDGISSRHLYGKDSILGHTIKYRMSTDSDGVFVDYDFTVMEIHPKINENLLSFLHGVMLNWGFINEKDSITPWTLNDLIDAGLTQQEIVNKIFEWEEEKFNEELPIIYKVGDYELYVEIYPVYMNDNYITFRKFAYYYTGGPHGNHTSFLQTYNLKTGESISLEDMIEEDKCDKFRSQVVKHMASSYPIYDNVKWVEQYFDTLNHWLGVTDLGVLVGDDKETDIERINERNYPLNDPGINETGLVITYEKYHLTPGADGVPAIVLTYDEVRDCLKAPFNQYKTAFPEKDSQ